MNFKPYILTLLILINVKLFSQCYTLPSYCTPTFANVAGYSIGLQNVTIGTGLNNSSVATGNAPNYFDYTNMAAIGAAGSSVSVSITNGSGNLTEARIYVDYNQNGTFSTTTSEAVWVSNNNAASAVVTGSFTIPSGTPAGIYRLRVTGDYQAQTVNPCALQYGEVEDYTLVVTGSSADAAAVAHTSPTYFIAGNNTIGFSMRNMTSTTMTSVDIGYMLAGGSAVTQSISGLSIASGASYTATFTTALNIPSTGNYNMKVWLNNVNGAGTATSENDTLCRNFNVYCSSALNGSYTIDPSGSGTNNFRSFGAVDTSLKACGISGPVVFKVAQGTYTYQMDIAAVTGSSSTNTITFDGDNAATRILTFPTTAANPHVVRFNACSYVKFRNMTIRSTSVNNAFVVHFMNGSNNTINNCIIEITGTGATATNTTLAPVVINGSTGGTSLMTTASSTATGHLIDSCTLNAGYYSVFSVMSTVANTLTVNKTTMNNAYFYGFNSNGNCSPKITGNTFNLRNNNNGNMGIQIFNCNNTLTNFIEISNNKISNMGQYGIQMSSCSHNGTAYNKIYNNMIGGGFRQNTNVIGISMNSVNRAQVYHNSINIDVATINGTNAALSILNGTNNDVRNNHLIISNATGFNVYPLILSSGTVASNVNYNNYYNNSSNNLASIGGIYYTKKNFANALPTGAGANSISRDPYFVTSTNLHTTNSCNAGIDLTASVGTDYDGNTRTTTPDIGADEVNSVPNDDLGVMKINFPTIPMTSGSKTVNVTLRNYGGNTITSATVKYILNGGTPVSQSWTGSLSPCDTVNFVFTTAITASSGSNNLKVFTSLPNSNTDAAPKNDTTVFNGCGALNGNYTIGASGNFTSFKAAVNALVCGGVTGPVTFNVAGGTYNEQIFIPAILGVSAANSITFQSASGKASDVNLVFSSTITTSNYTLYLYNSDFVKFNNMSISASGSAFGTAVRISNNSSNDSFRNVTINSVVTTSNSTNLAAIFCNSGISDFTYFGNCRINNGAYGSYFVSLSNLPSSQNLTFNKCTFTNQYAYGMYNQFLTGLKLTGNKITTNSTLTTYFGMYNYWIMIPADVNKPEITGNRISGAAGGTGIYNQYLGVNSTVNAARRPLVANNTVQIGTSTNTAIGIRDLNANGTDYIHNSVNTGNSSTASTSAAASFESTSSGNTILNNSFAAYNGGPAMRIITLANYTSNYNNLYTNGSVLTYFNTTSQADIAAWRTASAFDANSVSAVPFYTTNIDLHANQSLLDNAGFPSTLVATDIDGQPRCPNGGCAGSSSSPDIGADEFVAAALDAYISSVDGPSFVCPGANGNVAITLKNLGSTTLTSATIQFSVNGVAKTPYSWTGSLVQGASTSSFVIGNVAFPNSSNSLKIWVEAPNAGTDGNAYNDTIYNTPSTMLKGNFTIGGASPDFANFTEAANALNSGGVCGRVTFNVRQGIYPERIRLNTITGSSVANFITFRADPANTLPSEITINGNATAADNHTIFLNGTSFITFRNLKISNTSAGNSTYGAVVRLEGTQDSVTFVKNIITGPVTTSTSAEYAVIKNGTGATHMINRFVLDSNSVINGSYGVYLYGNTSTNASTFETKNRIRHNQITGAYYRGIESQFQRKNEIINNKIWLTAASSTGGAGIWLDYVDSFRIERNNINNFGQYGIYASRANYQFGSGSYRSTLNNNMIGGRSTSASAYGIYLQPTTPMTAYLNIFHNSVSINSSTTGSAFFMQQTSANMYSDLDIRNNTFSNFGTGTYTCWFYASTPINNLVINYNNYYSPNLLNLFVINQGGYSNATGGSPAFNANSIAGNPGHASEKTNLHAVRQQLNDKATLISSCAIDMDGQTRPMSPSTNVDMGADEYHPVIQDLSVIALLPINLCTSPQSIGVRVQNTGLKQVDSFMISWKANGIMQSPLSIRTAISVSNTLNVTLTPSFALTSGTTYNFQFWTYRPNGVTDSIPDNDTLTTKFDFMGSAPSPSTVSTKQCGIGKVSLAGTPASPSDSIAWYTASTGGTLLGIGSKITGPSINKTTTFYAQGMRISKPVRFGPVGNTNVNSTNTSDYGGMINVNMSNTVLLDSLNFRVVWNTNPTYYKLYYKTGNFNGFERDATAWTLVNSGLVTKAVINGYSGGMVSARNLFLQAGQNYSFYLTMDASVNGLGDAIWSANGGPTVNNADMTIQGGGSIIIGAFGANQVLGNWHPEMTFVYKNQCSNGPRAPLVVTVNPRPLADVRKGSTFEGQFKAGDKIFPDVTEVGKTVIYELIAPSGYSDADHGVTWVVSDISVKTENGQAVPASEYTVDAPSASGPGKITLKPGSILLEKMVNISISLADKGPYLCDSTLSRWVMIAPTPKTNFKFKDTQCLGESIIFENLSSISSGTLSYMWYFGDGDSSDLQNPIHDYKTEGIFSVRLKSTSNAWGVVKDTVLTVEVSEIPKVKFKANNKCQGNPVEFQNQSTINRGTVTYNWNFGDGSANTSTENPNHLYVTPGGYRVTLTVMSNSGCSATLTKNAYQFARPVANFIAPASPTCSNESVTLLNTSTLNNNGNFGAYWNFGDGGNSTLADGKHQYAAAGTYNVKLLTVSEFDCKDSIVKSVTIKPTPAPDFSGNQFCNKIPTVFTNNTPETLPNPVYSWKFSDNMTSSLRNVTRTWPNEGNYGVTLKATFSNGCSESVTKNVTVLLQPIAQFDVQDICSGETARFVNLSKVDRDNIQYNWDFGNGGFSTAAAPETLYNPSSTRTYTVTLVASYPLGCSDTFRKTITASESPLCDFTIKDMGNLTYSFTPGVNNYPSYEWFFGDGESTTTISPVYKYTQVRHYTVTLHATNLSGCECTQTKILQSNTGIDAKAAAMGIMVYPNPNTGMFTVKNDFGKSMDVKIFDVLGSEVYSNAVENGNMSVDLTHAAKGVYMVKVTVDGITTTSRITILD